MPSHRIGVQAYHINGIDRVEFFLNGYTDTPITVSTPSINPDTGNWEYWAVLDPSTYSSGLLELAAVIWPNTAGVPLVLDGPQLGVGNTETHEAGNHYFHFYANPPTPLVRYVDSVNGMASNDGTQGFPFQTIYQAANDIQNTQGNVDYAVIKLEAGTYTYAERTGTRPTNSQAYITIEAVDGVDRALVKISGSSGSLDTELVRFRNVRILGQIAANPSFLPIVWFDNCIFNGLAGDVNFADRGQWTGGIYLTDCEFKSNARGITNASMVSNTRFTDVPNEVFEDCNFGTGCLVEGTQGTVEAGSSLARYKNDDFEGVILSNIIALDRDQRGIVGLQDNTAVFLTNCAFVNVIIEHMGTVNDRDWQINCKADHVLFWHCSIVGDNGENVPVKFKWPGSGGSNGIWGTPYRNISVKGTIVSDLDKASDANFDDAASSINEFDYNHHFDDTPLGANSSSSTLAFPGGFVNPTGNNYHPTVGSILTGAIPQILEFDADANARETNASIGALEYQNAMAPSEFAANGDLVLEGDATAFSEMVPEGEIGFEGTGTIDQIGSGSGEITFEATATILGLGEIVADGEISFDLQADIVGLDPTFGATGEVDFVGSGVAADAFKRAGLTDYGEETFIRHLVGDTPAPSMVPYIALCTAQPQEDDTGSTITETTYTQYAREFVVASKFTIGPDMIMRNNVPITFTRNEDVANYTISHIGVCLDVSASELLLFSYLEDPIVVYPGHAATIEAGGLQIKVT